MKALKVFIVDDDPDFAEGVAITLQIEGHEVEFASSGEEAVEKLRERDFDVTFMDVRMPGMNGVESFFEIQKIKPDAKVIMMTAHSVQQLLKDAVAGGAFGVMHKPFGSEELLKAVEDVRPSGIILIADDDPDFVEGIDATLRGIGYEVLVAHTGREAIDKVLAAEIDILILDLRMPVLSGLEVYLELMKRGRSLPTLIVTGYSIEEAESIEALLKMSRTGFLAKPFRSSDLIRAIDGLTEKPSAIPS